LYSPPAQCHGNAYSPILDQSWVENHGASQSSPKSRKPH
jgi:hypothetical protein